mmetsp:Transcript_151770/g.385851  ORF Transcript_151770/g.385851 Transcript_151770/m.385851 type:complete len:443 (+) Transcript_151770:65-1393(+)
MATLSSSGRGVWIYSGDDDGGGGEELLNMVAGVVVTAADEQMKDEIGAGQAQAQTKTGELADSDENGAQSRTDPEDMKTSLLMDEQFLMMLKEKCQMVLVPCLSALVYQVKRDAVTCVKKVVDDMFAQHLRELVDEFKFQELSLGEVHQTSSATWAATTSPCVVERLDEIKHRDFRADELKVSQLQAEEEDREEQDFMVKIETLEMKIKALTETNDTLKTDVAKMQVERSRGVEKRRKKREMRRTRAAERVKGAAKQVHLVEAITKVPRSMFQWASKQVLEHEPLGQEGEYEKKRTSSEVGALGAHCAECVDDGGLRRAQEGVRPRGCDRGRSSGGLGVRSCSALTAEINAVHAQSPQLTRAPLCLNLVGALQKKFNQVGEMKFRDMGAKLQRVLQDSLDQVRETLVKITDGEVDWYYDEKAQVVQCVCAWWRVRDEEGVFV